MSSGAIEYNWIQPEEKILVDMIRADNADRPLTTEMITFGLPTEIVPGVEETYNTSVEVLATPVAPFRGSQYHRYHRVLISDFVHPGVTSLTFILAQFTNLESFATELGSRLGVNLRASSIVFTLPLVEGTYYLNISPDSLCYIGSLPITFIHSTPDLEEAIYNPLLEGFKT